jgi:hypothetical protein
MLPCEQSRSVRIHLVKDLAYSIGLFLYTKSVLLRYYYRVIHVVDVDSARHKPTTSFCLTRHQRKAVRITMHVQARAIYGIV